MAVSAFNHKTASGTGSKPLTTASITPTAGSLLLLTVMYNVDADINVAPAGTLGGTWTKIARVFGTGGNLLSQELMYCTNFNASGTVVLNNTGGSNNIQCAIDEVVGAVNANPIKQFKTGLTGGITNGLSLTYDVAPSNACYASFNRDGGGVSTAGTGYTKLVDNQDLWAVVSEYRLTPSTTAAVTQIGNANWTGIAVEFNVASGSRPSFKTGWRR